MARLIGIRLASLKRWLPIAIAVGAFAVVSVRLDEHGFWFDEAHTARLATVDWRRGLDGALADIHPPGWPLVLHVFAQLPVPIEVALRLPAAACLAALVALVAQRTPFGALALCFHGVLVDQATQARPYAALALGVAVIVELAARNRWLACGIASGLVASLHALAPAIVVLVWLGAVRWRDMRVAPLVIPALLLSAPWLPSWLGHLAQYSRAPWYPPSPPSAWASVTDGVGGLVAWIAAAAISRSADRSFAGATAALLLGLVALTLAGVGVEIAKLAVIFPALLVCAVRGTVPSALLPFGFLITSVPHDVRPDLREAARVVPGGIPVVSVFASEAAFYFRDRPPIPSYTVPDRIERRVLEVLDVHEAPCVAVVSLPGTFPGTLPSHAPLQVPGLDVRLACAVSAPRPSSASP